MLGKVEVGDGPFSFPYPLLLPSPSLFPFPLLHPPPLSFILHPSFCTLHAPFFILLHFYPSFILSFQTSSFIPHPPSFSPFILHPLSFIFLPHPPPSLHLSSSFSFILHPPSLILLLHSPFSFILHPSLSSFTLHPTPHISSHAPPSSHHYPWQEHQSRIPLSLCPLCTVTPSTPETSGSM